MLIYFSSLLHFAHQCCCTCVNNQAAWVTVVSYQVLELGNMTFFIKVCLGFGKDCVDFLAKIMKNHHFNEIVFQTINMEYLSIYIFFGFFFLVFYLFAYISCTCFVRFILKFYSVGIWIYIFNSFFFLIPGIHCWCIRKQMTFTYWSCILRICCTLLLLQGFVSFLKNKFLGFAGCRLWGRSHRDRHDWSDLAAAAADIFYAFCKYRQFYFLFSLYNFHLFTFFLVLARTFITMLNVHGEKECADLVSFSR